MNSKLASFFKEQFSFSTVSVVTMGLLVAMEIVLNRFASFNVWNLKIGLAFIPVMIAGMLMGPVKAGIVGAVADFLGAILFPIGAYFPGFTLTAFIRGVLYGSLLYKKQTILTVSLTAVLDQFILSLFLTSAWISILYGSPYFGIVYSRLVQVVPLAIVEIVIGMILPIIVKELKNIMNQNAKKATKSKSKNTNKSEIYNKL